MWEIPPQQSVGLVFNDVDFSYDKAPKHLIWSSRDSLGKKLTELSIFEASVYVTKIAYS